MAKDKYDLHLTLDRGLWRRLRLEAARREKPANYLIERALIAYLPREQPKLEAKDQVTT
jgi:hypothetical protein